MLAGICILFVAVFNLQLADGGIAKRDGYVPIKYPGPVQEVTQNRYGSSDGDVPEACRNQNFCTIKPPDYPQERFNKMFKGTKRVQHPALIFNSINLSDRNQGDPDETDDCVSKVSYEPLYKVRTKRGDWRTVVQAPEENYVQMVRLETCSQPGESCFNSLPKTPSYKTFCKQKTSVWEFLVAADNNGTEKMTAELPICCSCHYKRVLG